MSLSMKPRSRPLLVVTTGPSFVVAAPILLSSTEERNGNPASSARHFTAERRLIFAVFICITINRLDAVLPSRRSRVCCGSLRTHLDAFSTAGLQLYDLAVRVLGFVTVAVHLQSSTRPGVLERQVTPLFTLDNHILHLGLTQFA